MNQLRRTLYDLAADQHGLITRTDLAQHDVSPGRRRALLSDGTLEPIGRQVWRVGGSPPSARQRVMAACLEVRGVASHATGCWLHRIGRHGPGHPPQVTVARARYDYRPQLAEVHTTTWLPSYDVVEVDGIPCLGIARTLFSLAALAADDHLDPVRDAVDEAIRDGKATDPWLWWRLEQLRRRGRRGVRRFEQVLAARNGGLGTESWLEREFLHLLQRAGLPLPVCQARLHHEGSFVARVDFLYPPERVVLEVMGHASHSTRRQVADDAARRNALVLAGYRVLEFTYDQVVREPDVVVARVRQVLAVGAP